jgi:hypothetical protein
MPCQFVLRHVNFSESTFSKEFSYSIEVRSSRNWLVMFSKAVINIRDQKLFVLKEGVSQPHLL